MKYNSDYSKKRKPLIRIIALVLICLLCAGALAETMIVNTDSRVYKSADLDSRYAALKKGTEVNLLAVKDGWARIERSGVIGYTKASHLSAKDDSSDKFDELMKDAEAAVITKATRVYASASTSARSMKVAKGTKVNLLAVNGSWAIVERSGNVAYVKSDAICPADKYEPETNPILIARDAVITKNTRVYRSPSTSSSSMKVAKGMKVELLDIDGDWAMVRRSGTVAYMKADHIALAAEVEVTPEPTPAPTATPTPKPTATPTPKPTATPKPAATPVASSDYMSSSKYSNEEKCFLFLTREAGLNTAAACGILANIRKECNFNPAAGSSYYGLCQWGGGRLTNLKSFCAENGYEYSSLEGQLRFLIHELKKSYSSVLTYLKNVDDSAQGAYDAAYHFCYYYERPANKVSSSESRGELARSTYFPRYAN